MGCSNNGSIIEAQNNPIHPSNQFITITCEDKSLEKEEDQVNDFVDNKQEQTRHQSPTNDKKDNFIIRCDCHESLILKWFKTEEMIHFEVKGKWRPDPTLPECDSKGFNSYKMDDYNYGSLIGRILSSSTFQINNNTEYQVEKDGPLLLKMNAPRSNLNSKGELIVKVYGGEDISFNQLNERTGWNINSIELNSNYYSFNRLEEELFIGINKIRRNSKLFAEQYITSNPLLHKEFISQEKKPFPLFTVNELIYPTLSDFKKGMKKTSGSLAKEKATAVKYEGQLRVALKSNNIDIAKCQFTVKLFKEVNSHKILMKLLVIDAFLQSIFDQSNTSMIIKSIFIENQTMIIVIFSK